MARRTREIGIRMALGAARESVLGMVMKEVSGLAGLGILLGLPMALALSRLVESQLYGLTPHDPATLVGATGVMALVAAVAGFVPARRAAGIDPITALRYE